jgi:hypothetical protein
LAKKVAEGRFIARNWTVNFHAMRKDFRMRLVREPHQLKPAGDSQTFTGGFLGEVNEHALPCEVTS